MTPDGFLRTGDVAVVDRAGFVRIVDRKKDMILVSGFNVYPNEVEDIVAACPAFSKRGPLASPIRRRAKRCGSPWSRRTPR